MSHEKEGLGPLEVRTGHILLVILSIECQVLCPDANNATTAKVSLPNYQLL